MDEHAREVQQRRVNWLVVAGAALLLMFGLNALYTQQLTGVAVVGLLAGAVLLAVGLLRRA
jgi:uncharacterized membrane protein HdeD (DUF308 family)